MIQKIKCIHQWVGRNVIHVLVEPKLFKQLFILGRAVFLKCPLTTPSHLSFFCPIVPGGHSNDQREGQTKQRHSLQQEPLQGSKCRFGYACQNWSLPQWVAHQHGALRNTWAIPGSSAPGGAPPHPAQEDYLLKTKCAHFLTHSQHLTSTQFCARIIFIECFHYDRHYTNHTKA